MIGRLNHVAIAVKDLAAASAVYRGALGATVTDPVAQPEHGVTAVFIELPNTKIELLEPLGAGSPIAKFLEKNPDAGEAFKDPEVLKILFYTWARDLLLPQGRDPEEDPAYGTPRMAMKFMNNQRLQSMINAYWKDGMLGKVLAKKATAPERVEELFLALLGRYPTKWEKNEFTGYIGKRPSFEGKQGYEDVFWVLLNSTEFLFVH